MSVLLLIIGLILFVGLVVIHEYGHFIAARRGGVEVEEFGIFFPPRLYKKKMKGGWDFTINLLPLGGFVKLKGEHDSDTEPGSFGAAPLSTKVKVMVAGVLMNLVTALVLFTIAAVVGLPKLIDNQFTVQSDTTITKQEVLAGYIAPGSPADKAGLRSDDYLRSIQEIGYSPVTITKADQLPKLTPGFAGKTVYVFYERDGKDERTKLTLNSAEKVLASKQNKDKKDDIGYLGLSPGDYILQKSTWSAPIVAVGLSAQITGLTLQGLGNALGGLGSLFAGLFTGNTEARQNGQTTASEQVSGPVGIFVILQSGSGIGPEYILFIIAIISLTLAIMNILPIPALDGGRLWITLAARALKRPLSAKTEETVNIVGFVLLMILIIVITSVDVQRFF